MRRCYDCFGVSFQLKVRDERLGTASELQKFLQNLDHFQQWLTRTQTTIASEDIPQDLAEAERVLAQHKQIKEEVEGYSNEYASMKDYGEKVVEDEDSVQHMFLREVSVQPPLTAASYPFSPHLFVCLCITETEGT